jgi:hypothetical protein
MRKASLYITTVFILSSMLAGCSKSSDNSTGSNSQPPALSGPTFSGPSSSSTSADTSSGYITATYSAELFSAFSGSQLGSFAGAGNAKQNGNTWTWTVSANGVSETWTATSNSGGYDWKLVYSGPYQSGDTTYNVTNWTVWSGHESSDGKDGNWTIHYPGNTSVEFQVTWSTDSNGNLTGTITDNDNSEEYKFTDNKDKSGTLDIFEGANFTAQTWHVTWNSTGSGSYWEKDNQGNIIAQGTWS